MASALRVSPAFLNGLKALFPETATPIGAPSEPVLQNPWYIVAAVAFSASNRPECVPQVFTHALADLRLAHGAAGAPSRRDGQAAEGAAAAETVLAQRLRDALFKSGLISGYPKAINSLVALHEAMPAALRETSVRRDTTASLADYEAAGARLFRTFYGDQAASVQALLDAAYPDMGWFSQTIGYGVVYGHLAALSPLATSYTLVAALIAGDTPQQIGWHLESAQRGGAALDEVRAVREVVVRVAELAGVRWRHAVPEVQAVRTEEV